MYSRYFWLVFVGSFHIFFSFFIRHIISPILPFSIHVDRFSLKSPYRFMSIALPNERRRKGQKQDRQVDEKAKVSEEEDKRK